MLSELKTNRKVVGIKQLRKALRDQKIQKVFLAQNADPSLLTPLEALCRETGTQTEYVATLKELGTACGIDVGAACAGILRE